MSPFVGRGRLIRQYPSWRVQECPRVLLPAFVPNTTCEVVIFLHKGEGAAPSVRAGCHGCTARGCKNRLSLTVGSVQPAGTWLRTSTEVMVVPILVRLVTCPTVDP